MVDINAKTTRRASRVQAAERVDNITRTACHTSCSEARGASHASARRACTCALLLHRLQRPTHQHALHKILREFHSDAPFDDVRSRHFCARDRVQLGQHASKRRQVAFDERVRRHSKPRNTSQRVRPSASTAAWISASRVVAAVRTDS